MKEEFLKHLQRILREDQRALEENMSSHVTFRTGGPAEYYVRPNRQQIQPVLELCRRFDVPWMVIGNGSNIRSEISSGFPLESCSFASSTIKRRSNIQLCR